MRTGKQSRQELITYRQRIKLESPCTLRRVCPLTQRQHCPRALCQAPTVGTLCPQCPRAVNLPSSAQQVPLEWAAFCSNITNGREWGRGTHLDEVEGLCPCRAAYGAPSKASTDEAWIGGRWGWQRSCVGIRRVEDGVSLLSLWGCTNWPRKSSLTGILR